MHHTSTIIRFVKSAKLVTGTGIVFVYKSILFTFTLIRVLSRVPSAISVKFDVPSASTEYIFVNI